MTSHPRPRNREELLGHIKAHPVEGSVSERRSALAARLDAPNHLGREFEVGGVAGLCFGAGPTRAIFLHGGGYVLGSPRDQSVAADRLARGLGEAVFAPRYPRAPEHLWPAQIDCVSTVLDALDDPVTLIGSSAGGHLALVAALRHPDRVAGLALFSPNTDRTGRSSTREANTPLDAMNSDKGDRELWEMVAPDLADDDPDASPLLGDLSVLPPTYVSATEGEVLLGDTLALARALEESRVPHEVHITDYAHAGMHMFESWPDILPAGAGALDRAVHALARLRAT